MINNVFQAIYNPFTKKLAVRYGNTVTVHTFTEEEEWVKISYNGDKNHPHYLHVQLDYDEELQLLFYPRRDGDNSLHELDGHYFHSSRPKDKSDQITMLYDCDSYRQEFTNLTKYNVKHSTR